MKQTLTLGENSSLQPNCETRLVDVVTTESARQVPIGLGASALLYDSIVTSQIRRWNVSGCKAGNVLIGLKWLRRDFVA